VANPPIKLIDFSSGQAVLYADKQKFTFPIQGQTPGAPGLFMVSSDPTPAIKALKDDFSKLLADALKGLQSAPNPAPVPNPVPNPPAGPTPVPTQNPPPPTPAGTGWPPSSISPGQTINVPAGTFTGVIATDQPITVKGTGMRKSILDGQRGVGAGHRLAWGKGIIHAGANITVQDVGFVNGGGGDGSSDAESGFYAEGFDGTATLLRCAFDNCEDGIFVPNVGLANVDLVIDGSLFGRNGPNGLNDGRSHDLYVSGRSVTIRNSIFVGNSRGNTVKCRGPKLLLENNWIARVNGRFVDLPGGTDAISRGNTYLSIPGGNVQNAFGFYDENDAGVSSSPGSFDSDGDTFYFQRSQGNGEVIWVANPGFKASFKNAKVFWIGAKGAPPPVVTIQGSLVGDNPFLKFDDSNRVDTAPAAPADPAPPA
jgi:hypothetical protein